MLKRTGERLNRQRKNSRRRVGRKSQTLAQKRGAKPGANTWSHIMTSWSDRQITACHITMARSILSTSSIFLPTNIWYFLTEHPSSSNLHLHAPGSFFWANYLQVNHMKCHCTWHPVTHPFASASSANSTSYFFFLPSSQFSGHTPLTLVTDQFLTLPPMLKTDRLQEGVLTSKKHFKLHAALGLHIYIYTCP